MGVERRRNEMRYEISRHEIKIIPENQQDEAYIEDTLGLKHDGEWIRLRRRNAHGLLCIAYLETVKDDGCDEWEAKEKEP